MTRACLLLSHGQAVRATRMHPAVWLWVALLMRDSYRRYRAPNSVLTNMSAPDGVIARRTPSDA
jgi:hypothetical protein